MSQSVQLSVRELFITRLFTYQLSLESKKIKGVRPLNQINLSTLQKAT